MLLKDGGEVARRPETGFVQINECLNRNCFGKSPHTTINAWGGRRGQIEGHNLVIGKSVGKVPSQIIAAIRQKTRAIVGEFLLETLLPFRSERQEVVF